MKADIKGCYGDLLMKVSRFRRWDWNRSFWGRLWGRWLHFSVLWSKKEQKTQQVMKDLDRAFAERLVPEGYPTNEQPVLYFDIGGKLRGRTP